MNAILYIFPEGCRWGYTLIVNGEMIDRVDRAGQILRVLTRPLPARDAIAWRAFCAVVFVLPDAVAAAGLGWLDAAVTVGHGTYLSWGLTAQDRARLGADLLSPVEDSIAWLPEKVRHLAVEADRARDLAVEGAPDEAFSAMFAAKTMAEHAGLFRDPATGRWSFAGGM